MYDDFKKRKRHDMWRAFPHERMEKLKRSIRHMDDGRDKIILELAFIHGLTTTEIAEVAKTREDMLSRNHKPISRRTIQNIIAKYVPDRNDYQDHSQQNRGRKDHSAFIANHRKTNCVLCGSAEGVEWHHMIPVAMGGTAEPENMICLCSACHDAATAYQLRILRKK